MGDLVAVRRTFTLGDREGGYYQYVRFTVGSGVPGLAVRIAYDRSAAILDLGIVGPNGFRGWSGGERDHFLIGSHKATPGYLPGPIDAGEWAIVLALYRVPPDGVEVTVDAEGTAALPPDPPPDPPVPEPTPLERPAAAHGRRWVAGDLHAHTVHSDGRYTVAELAALARSVGLDFLAVTDHNTVSHHPELDSAGRRYGISLLQGQEVTTPDGHANCFGDVGWVDFREGPGAWAAHAAARGGLLSINHPVAGDLSWRLGLETYPNLVEVWHSSWDRRGDEPLAWWRRLGSGVPVGGSDFHRPGGGCIGTPTTWVEVDERTILPNPGQVMAALAAGRVAITASPNAPSVVEIDGRVVARPGRAYLSADSSEPLTLVHESGSSTPAPDGRAEVTARPGVWRLEDATGLTMALTVSH